MPWMLGLRRRVLAVRTGIAMAASPWRCRGIDGDVTNTKKLCYFAGRYSTGTVFTIAGSASTVVT